MSHYRRLFFATAITLVASCFLSQPCLCQTAQTAFTPEETQLVLKKLDKMITATPKDPDLYYLRASTKAMSGDYKAAIPDLAQARDLGTKKYEFDVYSLLGVCYTMEKNHAEALVNYNRAVSLKPFDADAYSNRGGSYCQLGKYREALADFSQAIKLDSSLGDPYSGIGECYCKSGQYAYAITYLNKAIARDRQNFESYFYRGTAYQKLGQPQVAARDFAEAKRLGWAPNRIYMHSKTK